MKRVIAILLICVSARAGREFAPSPQRFGHLPPTHLSTNLHGASGITVAAWIKPTSFVNVDGGDVILAWFGSGPTAAFGLRTSSAGLSNYMVFTSRRQSSDSTSARYATNTIPANAWSHVVGRVTFGAYPDVFINGSISVGATGGTNTSSGTFVSSAASVPDGIGCATTVPLALLNTNRVMRGWVAELAVWKTALGSNDIAQLAAGRPASEVRREDRVFYTPLVGTTDAEQDLVGGVTATMTNSPGFSDHPRIYYP